MPVHDWTLVNAGIFHHFHQRWIGAISDCLNAGLLPPDYYALAEQVAGGLGPDFWLKTEDDYVHKQNRIVIRHYYDDRVVALVEIVSPGNKASRHALHAFVEKAAAALEQACHLLILDLHPPTPRDPDGIHDAVWSEVCDEPFHLPEGKPLTLVAYSAGPVKNAYVEPFAVGDLLSEMPLFLEAEAYTNVPLEPTYAVAFRSVPERWRRILEAQ